ncbi:CDP-alcohol phosphatidyltransferase family protein [Coraliomargarita sp. SDUM461004]|uniref:CDP-alcohol phosphatidyltransferase family protein n=1 Tax=Thalassobacterium sedimentorum TaxID=3041258 RepID=A0ABU1AE92_9BACT|nr:CDP-alcohol phosphatidyltransferase family protein [Coraliomargarita sp. SDUM461004]MDQ8193085.1 CDP-alcohol phosphatidyltransferase family protein [Coraliomargarita sp. SDUM461004]
MHTSNRRPLKTRSMVWAQKAAAYAAHAGLSPNQISLLGIIIAAIGGFILVSAGHLHNNAFSYALLCILAAITIQLRLLCNMLDGMVAMEFKQKSALGDLYNELPDRIEDSIFLVAAGYAFGTPGCVTLGWLAALLAACAAYVRVLGGSLGFKQDFCGPQAKQQRMFLLTVSLLIASFWSPMIVYGLVLITLGTVITIARRLFRLANLMQSK